MCGMHYQRVRRGQSLDTPPRYGGSAIGYHMAHLRAKQLWGTARSYPCVSCGEPAREWAYDGTDPQEQPHVNADGYTLMYSAWPEFYKPLCVRCHRNEDVRRSGRERKQCGLEGCKKIQHAKGLCNTHYLGKKRGFKPNYRLLGA